jgi:hypothetical protein
MNQNNADSAELTNLINQAKHEVSSQLERQRAQARRKSNPMMRLAIPFTALLLLGYLSFRIWADHTPPSKEKVEADLERILYAARDTIEAARDTDGKLPESIPNASIAAVVQYHADAQKYKLSTTILGVRVTLEQGGKTITQFGVEK